MKFVHFKIFLLLIALSSVIYSQRLFKLSVDINGKEEVLSYVTKAGNTYASVKELGGLLSANVFYNPESAKMELKFPNYTIKFTAQNQFIIILRKPNNSQSIFQFPVSTLLINDDIFIPVIFSLDYLSLCYGKKIEYYNQDKKLKITDEDYSSLSLFVEKSPEGIPSVKDTIQPPQVKPVNSKYDIYALTMDEKSNGTLIRLKAARKISIPRHSIGNNTLYVFFANASIAPDIIKNLKPVGFVKEASRSLVSPKNAQLEFKLDEGYSTAEVFRDVESDDIIITIQNKFLVNQNTNVEEARSKWIFDTVVIDAGHGGRDPGAIGVTGVKEKVINLGIALSLGKMIEKNLPSVKVIYTRNSDQFVELYKRGKIANDAGGKLFISIHCNSTQQKDIGYRGFEVYLLRPGRTKQAIAIAEFENSVINFEDNPNRYQKLTDENFILVSMAHSQYMRFSEKFSDLLNQSWNKEVNIPSLGIKQAGFYVLVGASMPGVLIESGFLSNRKDEAHLASSSGQTEVAEAICDAVKKYKEYYDKEIEILERENTRQTKQN